MDVKIFLDEKLFSLLQTKLSFSLGTKENLIQSNGVA